MEQLVARRAHNPKVAGSSPVPATSQKPGPTPGLFSWSEGKLAFYSSNRKRTCCEATQVFGLMLPYPWSASAMPRAILSPLLAKSLGQRPGFFHGAKESLLSIQATEKRTCCEANTGFWLDAPLPMVRERNAASNPVPATSQKPGPTPGLFSWSKGKLDFSLD